MYSINSYIKPEVPCGSKNVHFKLRKGKFTCTSINTWDLDHSAVGNVCPGLRAFVKASPHDDPQRYYLLVLGTSVRID